MSQQFDQTVPTSSCWATLWMVPTFWDQTLAHSPYLSRVTQSNGERENLRIPCVVDPLHHLSFRVKYRDTGHGTKNLLLHAPNMFWLSEKF